MARLQLIIDALKAKKGAADFENAATKVTKSSKKAANGVEKLDKKMDGLGKSSGKLKNLLAGAFAGITIVSTIRSAISTISDFGSELATLESVTNASAVSMQAFEKQARMLGATTEFSAKQAAEGMTFLARAGFSTEEVMAAIGGTLDLATAGAIGLGEAADIASNVLSQFNLAAGETGRVGDILVNTANSANTNILQLAEAMKMAGPVAGSLGLSLEEVSAAAGVLGDSGIQASLAGTNLRGVMSALLAPTSAAEDALSGMGISMDEIDPATRTLTDIFKKFSGANLDAGNAVEIFGRRNAAAALILSSSIEKLEELTEKNKSAEGSSKDAADIIRNTLAGSFKTLASTVSEAFLTLGDSGFTGALRATVDTVTDTIRVLLGMETTTGEVTVAVQILTTAIKAATLALASFVTIKAIAAITTMTASVGGLSAAFAALRLVLVAHPVVAIATAIGAAGAAIGYFIGEMNAATDSAENMTVVFDGLEDQISNFTKIQDEIRSNEMFGRQSDEAQLLAEKIKIIKESIKGIAESANKEGGGTFVNFFDLEQLGVSMDDFKENLSSMSRTTQDAVKNLGENGKLEIVKFTDAIKLLRGELENLTAEELEAIANQEDIEAEAQARVEQAIAIKDAKEALEEQIQSLRDEREILKASDEYAERILARRKAEKETINLTAEERRKYLETIDEEIRLNQQFKQDQKDRIDYLKKEKEALETKNEAKQAIVDYVNALKEEKAILDLTSDEREVYNAVMEAEKILKEAGVTDTDKYIEAVRRELTALQQASDEQERLQEHRRQMAAENERLAQQWSQPFTDAVGDIVLGAETAKGALKNLFKSITDMAVNQMFLGPLQNMLAGLMNPNKGTGGPGLANLFGFTPSAKGNAFVGGNIIPFASGGVLGSAGGGIVNTPTVFSFGNGGKVGIMAEENSEAIMPLGRDSKGRLGVIAGGQSQRSDGESTNISNRNINVSMNVNTRDGNSFRKSASQIAADLKFMTSGM
jgi:TP901 family phage tail tape measure protein